MTIGIALLGAGIFAQREHLPAIEASDLLALKAIYSRSQKTADALAAKAKASVDVYYDDPAIEGRGLKSLLARDDIAAVAVCLPIALQPQIVRQVLAAGKHVISEKPVAETVGTAKALIQDYQGHKAQGAIWAVAENYRYQKSLQAAEEQVRAVGGDLVSFYVNHAKLVTPDGAYFNTPWRKVPTHPGGFLLDGGVHYIAALRGLLTAAGETKNEIAKLSCFSAQLQPILPPVDTLRAVAITAGGASGVISMSFGTEFGPDLEVGIVTTEGSVTWKLDSVAVVKRGQKTPAVQDFSDRAVYPQSEVTGVVAEFAAFAASIAAGKADPRQSPEEALVDLEVLEAMLVSGEQGGALKEVRA